jgi:hypothetical protein
MNIEIVISLRKKKILILYNVNMQYKITMNQETGILKTSRKTIKHNFTSTINLRACTLSAVFLKAFFACFYFCLLNKA